MKRTWDFFLLKKSEDMLPGASETRTYGRGKTLKLINEEAHRAGLVAADNALKKIAPEIDKMVQSLLLTGHM